jgi:hypothetical protein
MVGGMIGRVLCATLLVLLVLVCVSGSALAAPVWRVSSAHGPENFEPGGEGEYAITAFNTAFNTTASVTNNAVLGTYTIVDKLPAGVEATRARSPESDWNCEETSFPATVVTCNSSTLVLANSANIALNNFFVLLHGSAPVLYIDVKVASNASGTAGNEVTISGGGAATVTTVDPTTFSTTQPGFGLVEKHLGFAAFSELFPGSKEVTQAGAHPFEVRDAMKFNLTLNKDTTLGVPVPFTEPDQYAKTVETELPLGLVGDPQATPKCTDAQFNEPAAAPPGGFTVCPAASQVGSVSFLMNNGLNLIQGSDLPNFTQDIPLYNMVPPKGAVAAFAFDVQTLPIHLIATLDPANHYAVRVVSPNTPSVFPVREVTVSLWGVPADPVHDVLRFHPSPTSDGTGTYFNTPANIPPVPFITLPSQCDTPTGASVSMNSWQEPEHEITVPAARQTPTGCENQKFTASIKAQPTSAAAGAPTGLSFDLEAPQDLTTPGLGTPPIKKVTVTLPEGMTLSPSAANGLQACTPAQIGLGTNNPVGCPDASKVGSVEVKTPNLEETVGGSVYVASQNDNPFKSLIALYMVLEDKERGLLVKLPGEGKLDPNTGRITTTFDENPQLPFSNLHLQFKSGPRAPLTNPGSCGTRTTAAQIASWNSSLPVVNSSDPSTINENCRLGFAPSFMAGTTSNQAGAFSPFVLSFSRTDADQQISGLTDTFPPGASAVIKGVTQCSQAQVAAAENGTGGCPEASRIGSVTVGSGAGSNPVFLKGSVYLTGAYNGGPFGEAVIVPAVAGPFNLGNVVVRGSIRIDPKSAQPTVASDPFPQFVKNTGIPTDVQRVDVTLDRQKFTFNPTNCKELKATATLTSTQGATANVSSRFQAAECEKLAFKPKFSAATSATVSRNDGASLTVKVSYPGGSANIRSVKVKLPRQLASRLSTLQQACPAATFAANPASCPAGSVVGSAQAVTPLLAAKLSGPAYFVSHGGAKFPELTIVLQGEGVRIELGGETQIDEHTNITSSTFRTVPDAPVSAFTLNLPRGPHSALGSRSNLCAATLAMPTTITGQNGKTIKQATKIAVNGCHASKRGRAGAGRKRG